MADRTGSSNGGAGGSGGGNSGQGTGDQGLGAGQGQGEGSGTNNQGTETGQGIGQGQELVFDNWIKDQGDPIQKMIEKHEISLKSALDDERKARGGLEKQLRDLAAKAQKGSEDEKKLIEMADQMAEGDRRADFYDEAHKAGVVNLKLAYLVAVQEDLFDKRGNVDFEALKKDYIELFGQGTPKPKGNAGDGTGTSIDGKVTMDDFIRLKASGG